jgi:protein kinase A
MQFRTFSRYRTLQDATNVNFIMDYVPGGELFEYIRRNGRFVEPDARFFAAEIVEALAHLHAFGVMYRDLKPENVLLDSTGHIKLIDFGFAKVMPSSERTYTM